MQVSESAAATMPPPSGPRSRNEKTMASSSEGSA